MKLYLQSLPQGKSMLAGFMDDFCAEWDGPPAAAREVPLTPNEAIRRGPADLERLDDPLRRFHTEPFGQPEVLEMVRRGLGGNRKWNGVRASTARWPN
ncbi:MAG TPA: hypothetical protein ENK08_06300 [Chloroflexi bacterium]|nr:hypothetical protein [Chloroflexota bacterium]